MKVLNNIKKTSNYLNLSKIMTTLGIGLTGVYFFKQKSNIFLKYLKS